MNVQYWELLAITGISPLIDLIDMKFFDQSVYDMVNVCFHNVFLLKFDIFKDSSLRSDRLVTLFLFVMLRLAEASQIICFWILPFVQNDTLVTLFLPVMLRFTEASQIMLLDSS